MSALRVFLVRFLPYSDWIRRDTQYFSVFSVNVGKYGLEKLRILTLFTECLTYHNQLTSKSQNFAISKYKNIEFTEQPPNAFFKKIVFKNFTKLKGNHLCHSLFFNKVAGWGLHLYEIRCSGTGVFLWILRNFWKHLFTEHIRATASEFSIKHEKLCLLFFVTFFNFSVLKIIYLGPDVLSLGCNTFKVHIFELLGSSCHTRKQASDDSSSSIM